MFTGIIEASASVAYLERKKQILTLGCQFSDKLLDNIDLGDSISINGVCLTVIKRKNNIVYFNVVKETLEKTNLNNIKNNDILNIERSLKYGDKIGGHLLSGHVLGTTKLVEIKQLQAHRLASFEITEKIAEYIFEKGFIAINGISLTIANVKKMKLFSIALIPETLRRTNLKELKNGDMVNLEIDFITQMIVNTTKNFLQDNLTHIKNKPSSY